MAKKLKVKLTYKKNGTYKYKSLKRLLNDIKKKKGCKRCKKCKRCIRCKRCKKCKRCVRCKRCKKCNCNRRNRFGMDDFSSTSFDWEDDYLPMPAPAKKKTPAGMATARGIWKTNTPDEKKETWTQRLANEDTEKEWKMLKGNIPDRETKLTEEYNRLYLNNYNRRTAQRNANIPRAPVSIYKNAKIIEEPAFGKRNRFG
jgi:hypothetical protein